MKTSVIFTATVLSFLVLNANAQNPDQKSKNQSPKVETKRIPPPKVEIVHFAPPKVVKDNTSGKPDTTSKAKSKNQASGSKQSIKKPD